MTMPRSVPNFETLENKVTRTISVHLMVFLYIAFDVLGVGTILTLMHTVCKDVDQYILLCCRYLQQIALASWMVIALSFSPFHVAEFIMSCFTYAGGIDMAYSVHFGWQLSVVCPHTFYL